MSIEKFQFQTSSNDGNLSVMAIADLKCKMITLKKMHWCCVSKPSKKHAFVTFAPAPGTQTPISVSAGCFISRRRRDVLLLRRVVGISDHEKFLQR